jgi:hypothetical protein
LKAILIDKNNVKIALVKVDAKLLEIPQNNSEKPLLSEKRLIEKAGIAYLLTMFHPQETLEYNLNGKPFFLSGSHSISISHSKNWIGLAWSSLENLGLDIETIHERIQKVSDRYLHPDESVFVQSLKDKTIVWCIKECLIKLLDNKTIDFKNELMTTRISDDIWTGYSRLKPEKIYHFLILEENNSLICVNTTA